MGTSWQHRDKGITNEEFFKFTEGTTVHATGTVNNVFYAAIEHAHEPGKVVAFIAKTYWAPNDYHNFGYKDMDENMGPVDAEAPAKVLNALTPTDNATALAWRARCRNHLDQRAALKGLQVGDKVVLSRSFRFTDGSERDTFIVSRRRTMGKQTKVVLTDGFQGYQLPNWRNMVMSVERDGQTTTTPLGKSRATA